MTDIAESLPENSIESPKNNWTKRVVTSVVGIPLLLFLIFAEVSSQLPAVIYVSAGIFFSVTAAWEFFAAARRRGYQPVTFLACCAVALLQLYAWNRAPSGLPIILTSLFALLLIAALLHTVLQRQETVVANLGVTLLGVAYAGWLFSYLIRLRTLPGVVTIAPWGAQPHGAWVAWFVFATTWGGDTAALFAGRAFGKHPLAPKLSPAKTVEGSLGGLLGSIAMSSVLANTVGFPLWRGILLGVILSVLGQMGDLFASALKRDMRVKDFGGLLPGHGGVLDRFDSLLFAAPIAYYLFELWR